MHTAMNKINKVIACAQILVFLCLILCSGGVTTSLSGRSDEFFCKDHVCGCKSEADCKTNCCCSSQGNHLKSQSSAQKQKNGFHAFISSVRCKSGSDEVPCINFELKYIPEDCFTIPQLPFLCFLDGNTLARLSGPMVFPPEKPPRFLT